MSKFPANRVSTSKSLSLLSDLLERKSTKRLLPFVLAAIFMTAPVAVVKAKVTIKQAQVAEAITEHARANRFPNKLAFTDSRGQSRQGLIEYTFDPQVHSSMAEVYLKYQPDYACFVAMDVETGAILNLTSFIKSDEQWDNLVMRADYPAASVFKVITAAAGIDSGAVGPATIIPYNGKSTSLYKNQVLNHKTNKWTRNPTFEESFAKSINTVFGRIGVFDLGAEKLSEYANRFGFNQTINTDFSLPVSQITLDLNDQWARAEAASGYTREVKLSPVHAAQIAATIVNEGRLVTPYMVESIQDGKGEIMYQHKADPSSGMEIGGKTGSLTGFSPKGRHDWFVGFAEKDGRKVAYASLIINKEKWYVRSAYVARQFIYNYFTAIDERKKEALAISESDSD